MTSRISSCFEHAKEAKKSVFITYMMAYDPDLETSEALLCSLPEAGAGLIELGMPFSDPMADGPTIVAAAERGLEAGSTIKGIFQLVGRFRKKNQDTPLILMGYANPLFHYGYESFCAEAKQAGVDGLLIVDLPPEEDAPLKSACDTHQLDLIKLITPTTDDERFDKINAHASGFIYYVSITGITGTASASEESIAKAVSRFKTRTLLPIAVGFGIKTPEQVASVSKIADGVVVGSALVAEIAKAQGIDDVLSLTKKLAGAIGKELD